MSILKIEYAIILIIQIGAYLYIYTKNNITYHSIDKKYTAIIFTTTQIHMENKTIYYSINKKQINTSQPIAKTKQ